MAARKYAVKVWNVSSRMAVVEQDVSELFSCFPVFLPHYSSSAPQTSCMYAPYTWWEKLVIFIRNFLGHGFRSNLEILIISLLLFKYEVDIYTVS